MRRVSAILTSLAVVSGLPGLAQEAKKGDPKKAEAAAKPVESVDARGEPKSSSLKAISGPKVCLGYKDGEWLVQLRPGDADWTRIDGWIEVDEGGELTKVTGFANLETNKRNAHTDSGKFTKKRIDFELWVKSGGLDTFRFTTSEKTETIRCRFRIGQKLGPVERILIGKDGQHPSEGEFSLRARPDDSSPKRDEARPAAKPADAPKAKADAKAAQPPR